MDSFLQQEVIGKEFNEELNDLMYEYFSKRKFSKLGFIPRPGAIAMVHTLEDGMVKEVGASEPFDIINSNFGRWLAGMCTPLNANVADPANNRCPGGAAGLNAMIDTTNTGRTVYYYNSNTSNAWCTSSAGYSLIQIGQGVSSPDVDDFDIETPFGVSPESNKTIVIGGGAYQPSNGRVSVGTNIGPTAGSGTISELGLFTVMRTIPSATVTFMMSHDEISPTIPFNIGETIFAQYFFQL